MSVVRICLLFSFAYGGETYPCALVDWFKKVAEIPDSQTGMWIVEPEPDMDNKRLCSVLHLDSFVRGAPGNTVLFIYKCTVVTGYSVIHVELSLQVYLI
jgi:hypothetical protein